MKELRDEELASEKKSIETIREFESYRKHKMRNLDQFDSKIEYLAEYEEDLLKHLDDLEDDLMKFEMSL